ncbi:MAG TPA: hypothetical protein VGV89_01525 [Thermoplasmata archaeon]|nr:hypothetical protein [Thermoplasmata archaeon]
MSTPSPAAPRFETADKLAERPTSLAAGPLADPAVAALLVAPEVSLADMKRIWNAYFELKAFLLEDSACFDVIAGRKEMNRTGCTRLAMAFGLSFEEREVTESNVQDGDTGEYDHRWLVRVRVSKHDRFADGIASCRLSEIAERTAKGELVPISQREHFALTKASTRARKRAIADLLGGTEAE